MNGNTNFLEYALNYISTIRVSDVIDILIVAYIIYKAIALIRKTNFVNLTKGVFVFLMALWLSGIFKLTMFNYILRKAAELGLIALLILFQPELRRLLEKLGSKLSPDLSGAGTLTDNVIAQTVLACSEMAASKTGALIVFERKVSLNEVVHTGTVINSDVNAELLKNLFYNKAPLHDGAVIIKNGHIAAAGCILPLTKQSNLSKDLGMRHRAGIGMSEVSDAVVVMVSEESGAISVAIDGMLKRHQTDSSLSKILRNELIAEEKLQSKKGLLSVLKNILKG